MNCGDSSNSGRVMHGIIHGYINGEPVGDMSEADFISQNKLIIQLNQMGKLEFISGNYDPQAKTFFAKRKPCSKEDLARLGIVCDGELGGIKVVARYSTTENEISDANTVDKFIKLCVEKIKKEIPLENPETENLTIGIVSIPNPTGTDCEYGAFILRRMRYFSIISREMVSSRFEGILKRSYEDTINRSSHPLITESFRSL